MSNINSKHLLFRNICIFPQIKRYSMSSIPNTISTSMNNQHNSIPLYVYIINAVETIHVIIALFFTALSVRIFTKRSLCHRNLSIIITSVLFLYFVMMLGRLIICIFGFIDDRILCKKDALFWITWRDFSHKRSLCLENSDELFRAFKNIWRLHRDISFRSNRYREMHLYY